jgi:hypothetical protein
MWIFEWVYGWFGSGAEIPPFDRTGLVLRPSQPSRKRHVLKAGKRVVMRGKR